MAHKKTSHDKDALKTTLERARSNMSRNFGYVRYRTDVGARVKDSVRQHAILWSIGAIGVGAFCGWFILRPGHKPKKTYVNALTGKSFKKRKQKVKDEKKGMLLGLLGVAFSFIQPALVSVVSKKISSMVQHRED